MICTMMGPQTKPPREVPISQGGEGGKNIMLLLPLNELSKATPKKIHAFESFHP